MPETERTPPFRSSSDVAYAQDMQLDPDSIREFKKIYSDEFGEELSDTEAERRARQLLTFYEIILRIRVKHRTGEHPAIDASCPIRRIADETGAPAPDSVRRWWGLSAAAGWGWSGSPMPAPSRNGGASPQPSTVLWAVVPQGRWGYPHASPSLGGTSQPARARGRLGGTPKAGGGWAQHGPHPKDNRGPGRKPRFREGAGYGETHPGHPGAGRSPPAAGPHIRGSREGAPAGAAR